MKKNIQVKGKENDQKAVEVVREGFNDKVTFKKSP